MERLQTALAGRKHSPISPHFKPLGYPSSVPRSPPIMFYRPPKWAHDNQLDHDIQIYKADASAALNDTHRGRYKSPEPSPTDTHVDPFLRISTDSYNSAFDSSSRASIPRGYPLPPPPLPSIHYSDGYPPPFAPRSFEGSIAATTGGNHTLGGYFPPQVEVDPFYNPTMPPTTGNHGGYPSGNRGRSKTRAAKKVEGKQPTFLTKLYQILEQEEYRDIIRWDDAGDVIIIERPDELAENVLPLVYRQSRFASFSRQLNIYGWMRKVSLRHTERGIVDPDASTWSHPFLRRSSTREEILAFKRRVPPRPSQARRNSVAAKEEGLSPSSSSDLSTHSPVDAYRHLLDDVDGQRTNNLMVHSSPDSVDLEVEMQEGFNQHQSRQPIFSLPAHASKVFELPPEEPRETTAQHRIAPSSFEERSSHIPLSAPANTSSFQSPSNIQITQEHLRTRSVQGEPPSATLFSPPSPVGNQSSWVIDEITNSALKSLGPAPVFNPDDSGTWARRGFADISTGLYSSPTNSTIGGQGSIPGSSSLPNGFGGSFLASHPTFSSTGLSIMPQSYSSLNSDMSFQDNQPLPPATVSPGIYQTGFSLPSNYERSFSQAAKNTRPLSPPTPVVNKSRSNSTSSGVIQMSPMISKSPTLSRSPTLTKPERRASIGNKSPYMSGNKSPHLSRNKSTGVRPLTSSSGGIRTIDKVGSGTMRRGSNPEERMGVSQGYEGNQGSREGSFTERIILKDEKEDDGLPSGGLPRENEQNPFASVLPPEGMEMDISAD